jgi:hypothetical protein
VKPDAGVGVLFKDRIALSSGLDFGFGNSIGLL